MPNLNVGLVLAVVIVIPSFAASDAYFYDESLNPISTVGGSGSLSVDSLDDGCAVIGTTAYSCNGGCGLKTFSSVVNVPPNGSYFVNSYVVYVCSATGQWLECGQNPASSMAELKESLSLRVYDDSGRGYRSVNLGNGFLAFLSVDGLKTFCSDPYYHVNDGCASGVWRSGDCEEVALAQYNTSDGGGFLNYYYSMCAPGYYLKNHGTTGDTRGTECTNCPYVSNGEAYTSNWNSSSSCSIRCDQGYKLRGGVCVPNGELDYVTEGPCGYGAFDSSQYGDDRGCIYCHDDTVMRCDGSRIYCRADHYLIIPNGYTEDAYCEPCPANGTANVINEAGAWFGWDDNTGQIYACQFSNPYQMYDYGFGYETDCMWVDGSWTEYEEHDYYCQAYYGSDNTGNYEYRTDDGDWDYCNYRY